MAAVVAPPLGASLAQIPRPAAGSSAFSRGLGGLGAPAAASVAASVAGHRVAAARRRRRLSQRGGGRKVALAAVAGEDGGAGRGYLNVTGFPFPLGPLLARKTVRAQVGDGMWTFEQEQSLANIAVNTRMTAIRLDSDAAGPCLWIHNPVAPTEECVALVKELGIPVRYIVLGTTQYEHKIFLSPFSRRWPDARVFLTPQQWSWPLDLPPALLGSFVTEEVKDRDAASPWAIEIEQRVFDPSVRLGSKAGINYSAAECAFFHKRSKTLICTDALVYVPQEPPEVLDKDELMSLGRDSSNIILDAVALTNWRGSGEVVREAQRASAEPGASQRSQAELLRRGWKRDALLALFFGPDGRSVLEPAEAFDAIAGRWIVGPVCYSLVYGGDLRREVLAWARGFCDEWDFKQILPSHFAGPVEGGPDDVRRAFEVLDDGVEATELPEFTLPWPFPQPVRYRPQDLQLLTDIRGVLRTIGVI